MPFLVLILACLLFLLGVSFLIWASRQQKKSGLPDGRVIYSDHRNWGVVEEPLFDPEFQLVGKPDYLIKNKELVIPVEVKTGHAPESPYDSHIYQLAAYCRLVEVAYRKRPPYGLIHYPNKTFAIDYTPALSESLLTLLEEMRKTSKNKEINRSHSNPQRCRSCGYRSKCDQVLK